MASKQKLIIQIDPRWAQALPVCGSDSLHYGRSSKTEGSRKEEQHAWQKWFPALRQPPQKLYPWQSSWQPSRARPEQQTPWSVARRSVLVPQRVLVYCVLRRRADSLHCSLRTEVDRLGRDKGDVFTRLKTATASCRCNLCFLFEKW